MKAPDIIGSFLSQTAKIFTEFSHSIDFGERR
jgi:hypothetical protein